MNSAKFKTIRQSIGLSTESLGEILGVQPRSVQRWESGQHEAPAFAVAKILELHKIFLNMTNFQIDHIQKAIKKHGVPENIVLVRYLKDDFLSWNPDFKDLLLPESFHAAMTARIYDFCTNEKIKVEFVFFDESLYADYLKKEKLKDGRAARSQWASLQIKH